MNRFRQWIFDQTKQEGVTLNSGKINKKKKIITVVIMLSVGFLATRHHLKTQTEVRSKHKYDDNYLSCVFVRAPWSDVENTLCFSGEDWCVMKYLSDLKKINKLWETCSGKRKSKKVKEIFQNKAERQSIKPGRVWGRARWVRCKIVYHFAVY